MYYVSVKLIFSGNMWSQSWVNIEKLVKPYENAKVLDINKALKENVRIIV